MSSSGLEAALKAFGGFASSDFLGPRKIKSVTEDYIQRYGGSLGSTDINIFGENPDFTTIHNVTQSNINTIFGGNVNLGLGAGDHDNTNPYDWHNPSAIDILLGTLNGQNAVVYGSGSTLPSLPVNGSRPAPIPYPHPPGPTGANSWLVALNNVLSGVGYERVRTSDSSLGGFNGWSNGFPGNHNYFGNTQTGGSNLSWFGVQSAGSWPMSGYFGGTAAFMPMPVYFTPSISIYNFQA